jgi:TIR domain
MSGYEFDLFISYRRSGTVPAWVRNHLYPLLRDCLADELSREPRIFLDNTMETGAHWPARLERALRRSRLLLPVWSPQYFTSPWCLAEWRTMLAREAALGLATEERPHGLIYPLAFAARESLPAEARIRQCRDLKSWNIPYPQYQNTEEYIGLHREIRLIAEDLASEVDQVPPWQPDWPLVLPSVVVRPTERIHTF